MRKGSKQTPEAKAKASATRLKLLSEGTIKVWNKGLKGVQEAWNKNMTWEQALGPERAAEAKRKNAKGHKGKKVWNKGLTKETDIRVAAYAVKDSIAHMGKVPVTKGKKIEDVYGKEKAKQAKDRMSIIKIGKPSNHLGIPQSESAKQLAREAKLANYQDPKFLEKMEYKNQRVKETMKNVPKTKAQKDKMSDSKKGHEVTSETRNKISMGQIKYIDSHPEVREAKRKWRKTVKIPTRDSRSERRIQVQLKENGIRHDKHTSIDLFFTEKEKSTSSIKLPTFTQPDILLESYDKYYKGVLIFADGCAPHACPIHLGRMANARIKEDKLRWHYDQIVTKDLFRQGYYVIRLWEHDIKENKFNIVKYLKEIMPLEHLKGN